MLRVRVGAEVPRRSADRAARAVSQAGGEAAQPLGVHADPGRPPMGCECWRT